MLCTRVCFSFLVLMSSTFLVRGVSLMAGVLEARHRDAQLRRGEAARRLGLRYVQYHWGSHCECRFFCVVVVMACLVSYCRVLPCPSLSGLVCDCPLYPGVEFSLIVLRSLAPSSLVLLRRWCRFVLQASAEMLNGRWFAGRMVLVEYLAPHVSQSNTSFFHAQAIRRSIFFPLANQSVQFFAVEPIKHPTCLLVVQSKTLKGSFPFVRTLCCVTSLDF